MAISRPAFFFSRILAGFGTSAAVAFIGSSALAQSFDRITHTRPATGIDQYRIDRPNVRRPVTDYPSIPLRAGDRVTVVRAGGCVQTGGFGQTWKRYVHPLGEESDRKYWGLIQILGAMPQPVRIETIIGKSINVPSAELSTTFPLRLGYSDSDYSDNSYENHDNGNPVQCKGIGPAFVIIRVEHNARKSPAEEKALPLDLVWQRVDANAIPLNPKWGMQVGRTPSSSYDTSYVLNPLQKCPTLLSGASGCTKYTVSYDSLSAPIPFFDIGVCGPHVNWFPVTYEGSIRWASHSAPWADDDYNVLIATPLESGSTLPDLQSQPEDAAFEMEFDSDETVDVEELSSPWWSKFHSAVDRSDADARAMINGRRAITTGLFGLDCPHGCKAELHPLWAFAINAASSPDDEVWPFFIRTSGNEGFCSEFQHVLVLPSIGGGRSVYKLLIPWMRGATDVEILPSSVVRQDFQNVGPISVLKAPGQGLLLSFMLPESPAAGWINIGPLIMGELHLKWRGGLGREPLRSVSLSGRIGHQTVIPPEELLGDELGKLPPQQRTVATRALSQVGLQKHLRSRQARSSAHAMTVSFGVAQSVRSLPIPVVTSKPPASRAVNDSTSIAVARERADILKKHGLLHKR